MSNGSIPFNTMTMLLLCPHSGLARCGLACHQDTHSGLWCGWGGGEGTMRFPDRRLQMYTWPPPRYLSSVCLFHHCQTLHLTDSLQSFFSEIYCVLGAFRSHLAEPRTGPGWFHADFWGDRLLKSRAEATPCHLQSLSLTVPREVPPSLLNYHHCQELSDAFS